MFSKLGKRQILEPYLVSYLQGLSIQTGLILSSTGRRPASLCHGPLSVVRQCVRPCVNFFFKHLLL